MEFEDMAIKKKYLNVILMIICLSLMGAGSRLIKVYKEIIRAKKDLGYKSEFKNFTPLVFFERGDWRGILIDSDISHTDGAHNFISYDMDNKNNIVLIANAYRSDALILYTCKYKSIDLAKWSRSIIDASVGGGLPKKPFFLFVLKLIIKEKIFGGYTGGAHYIEIADMNGDNRNDLVLACDYKRYDVVWYEAPEEVAHDAEWKKHIVYENSSHRTYNLAIGDIDSDGDNDVAFTTKLDKSLGWLENTKFSEEWPVTWITKNCTRCFNVKLADINKDNRVDIIASEDDSFNGGKLHLYINSNNSKLSKDWTDYTIANLSPGHGASVFEVADFDMDDDLDIVIVNHQGDVYLIQNPHPNNTYKNWSLYRVNGHNILNSPDFRELDIGDIDNDGDLDIIVADEGMDSIIWFENDGNSFYEDWEEHVIDRSDQYLRWCHSVELSDIDEDGDLDVLVAAAASNTFLIYFNNM